jgi:hypothetical protein
MSTAVARRSAGERKREVKLKLEETKMSRGTKSEKFDDD